MNDERCHYTKMALRLNRHGLPVRAFYKCSHPSIVFTGECWLTREEPKGCIDYKSHKQWHADMMDKARNERPPNVRYEKA